MIFKAVEADFATQRDVSRRKRDIKTIALKLKVDAAPKAQALVPELVGVQDYRPAEFQEKVDWMMHRGFLREAPAYADVVRAQDKSS